jgi:hypothetical protein
VNIVGVFSCQQKSAFSGTFFKKNIADPLKRSICINSLRKDKDWQWMQRIEFFKTAH